MDRKGWASVPDHSPASQTKTELLRMLALRKELDPDAPDAIVLPESRLKADEATPQYLWIASPYVMPSLVSSYPLALRQLGTNYFLTEKEAISKARQFRIDHIDLLQKEVNVLDERYDAIEDKEIRAEVVESVKRRITDPD